MRQKALYYLQKGSLLVWLVYSEEQRVEVCTLEERGNLVIQSLDQTETLTGGKVLPELNLPIATLFNQ